MINPFSPKHPADPKYFVDRVEIIDAFERSLKRSAGTRPPKPDNIAVLGNWGSGKRQFLPNLNT